MFTYRKDGDYISIMKKQKLSNIEISDLCMGLSLLLHAGVSTGDGLALMAEEDQKSASGTLLKELSDQVDRGSSLTEALRDSGRFPEYVCGLLDVGERSGRMEEALSSLAAYYENRARLDRQIRAALMYPAILLLIMLAVIVILLIKVLPVFNEVYAGLGGRLTGVAGGLLALGQSMDNAMPVLCVILGVIVLFAGLFAALPSFRGRLLAVWQRHGGDRGVSRKINTARFAQSLSMGISSGLPLEEAIDLSASLLQGTPSAVKRCENCLSRLKDGESLAKAMGQSGLLPRTECRLLEAGMNSGSGDAAMEQIVRRLSEDSEMALEEKVGQVEPALMIITSVLVGLILLSVMLPLMHIMTAIG